MNPHNENPNPTQRETGFEPHVEVDGAVDVSPNLASGELSPAPAPGAWNFSSGTGGFPPPTRFIPEDLRVPWGWWDVALLAVIGLVGLLLFGTVFAAALQTAGVSRAQIQHSMVYQGRFAIVAMVFLSFLLLFYLALQMRLRFRSPILRTLRWQPLETRPHAAVVRLSRLHFWRVSAVDIRGCWPLQHSRRKTKCRSSNIFRTGQPRCYC